MRPHLDYATVRCGVHIRGTGTCPKTCLASVSKAMDIAYYVDLPFHFSLTDRRDYLNLCIIMYKIIIIIIYGLAYFHQNIFIPKSSTICYELPTTYSMLNLLLVQIHFYIHSFCFPAPDGTNFLLMLYMHLL